MRPSLVLHGLKVAQSRQLRARALRPLRRRRFGAGAAPPLQPVPGAVDLWRSPAFALQSLAGSGSERLRSFHAHYGLEPLEATRSGDVSRAAAAIDSWIQRNPARRSDAWHPYTTATRAGNWIAALSLAPDMATDSMRESLWRQLIFLARNVEEDVLGNHVIRNARALVLGGVAFSAPHLLERGLQLLGRELPQQVLADGGHYERSPVYHLVVLRDLLEVEAASGDPVIREVLPSMQAFAAALRRPDGAPMLFNDGTLDLAPAVPLPIAPEGLSLFPETGYAVVRRGRVCLAFDCGPPSPPFLPAHAHADVLSFQLWLDGEPIVVDPGMSTYEPGTERDWYRGTLAHSTIAIDGDQFELWGAFRAGPFPRVELLEASERELTAAVTGRSGVRHVRRLSLGDELHVEDVLEGTGEHALVSSLPLSKRAEIAIEATFGPAPVCEQRWVSERLFVRDRAPALVVSERIRLPAVRGWRLRLNG